MVTKIKLRETSTEEDRSALSVDANGFNVKGSPLTNTEVDSNFILINKDLATATANAQTAIDSVISMSIALS